ncbi:MAG: hypothetical protein JW788_06570 [Candidatus Omnitrophica bacterium]|nr:hypothetical protein [Candidatus Omnitrophota bacterium]
MVYRKTIRELKNKAVELGACQSKVIEVSSVKTASWVRYKCQFGCDGFGQCFSCPPYSPAPDETKKILGFYKKAVLIHCKSGSDVDISKVVLKVE